MVSLNLHMVAMPRPTNSSTPPPFSNCLPFLAGGYRNAFILNAVS